MAFFSRAICATLYLGQHLSDDVGAVAFVLPPGIVTPPGPDLDLARAVTDPDLSGSFVFAPSPMDFDGDLDRQTAFVAAIQTAVAQNPAQRDILWAQDPTGLADGSVEPNTLPCLGLGSGGGSVASALSAPIGSALNLVVAAGMSLTLDATTLVFAGTQAFTIAFSDTAAPTTPPILTGTLPFSGPDRGCIQFAPFIRRAWLKDGWKWGFQFAALVRQQTASTWFPLADAADPSSLDLIGFAAQVDPNDPYNSLNPLRTALSFTGSNQDGQTTRLASYYRTVTGLDVVLTPVGTATASGDLAAAALVFVAVPFATDDTSTFYVGPAGDFVVDAPLGPDGATSDLLCALQGTEFFALTPGRDPATGSRLRFAPGHAAYVSQFPPPIASPVGPPVDPTATPLGPGLLTSWATLLPPTGGTSAVAYVAQPKGFSQFGYDAVVCPDHKTLLGPVDPGALLSRTDPPVFPLPCYAGAQPGDGQTGFSAAQMATFEETVLGPVRRSQIGRAPARHSVASARAAAAGRTGGPSQGEIATTTPSGVLAYVQPTNGDWTRLLLGQTVTEAKTELGFVSPTNELQQAFQTSKLFLVVANAATLVTPSGHFSNQLDIGGWVIEAAVGQSPAYDDYANIVIVKGLKGPLFDPKGDPKRNLISNPDGWTKAATFAAPSVGTAAPDTAQLVAVSQWLQDYFAAAFVHPDKDFFAPFNALAANKDWTGTLILRARIATPPTDIAGILAGVKEPSLFYAHHLSVAISQIRIDPATRQIRIDQPSSIYGLIYYLDPAYDPKRPDQPVPPDAGRDYDFRVLSLKVLFDNTAVKRFSSVTQLTIRKLFGTATTGMNGPGDRFSSILLAGTFQSNNGTPAYSLGTTSDSWFVFDSNIYNKIEISSATLTTRSTDHGRIDSVFSLGGFIDFRLLSTSDTPGVAIDYLSFGSPDGHMSARNGLAFANLALQMSFDAANPTANRLTFDASQITFDLQTSTPRAGSLFEALSLDLKGLQQGINADDAPTKQGYLPLVTDVRLGSLGLEWTGLNFRLDLGTPGALASALGLNATLLLAWAPDSRGDAYKAQAAVQMPGASDGAKLISLQSVLSLSYGVLQLLYLPKADGTGRQFLLAMNEIAIKLLGVLKAPPSGNTAFYVFGAADSGDAGLGWFAMYQNQTKAVSAERLTPPAPPDAQE